MVVLENEIVAGRYVHHTVRRRHQLVVRRCLATIPQPFMHPPNRTPGKSGKSGRQTVDGSRIKTPVNQSAIQPVLQQDAVIARLPTLFHEIKARVDNKVVCVPMRGANPASVKDPPRIRSLSPGSFGMNAPAAISSRTPRVIMNGRSTLPFCLKTNSIRSIVSNSGGGNYKRVRGISRPRRACAERSNPVARPVELTGCEHLGIG